MSAAEIIKQVRRLSESDRAKVLAAVSRLVRTPRRVPKTKPNADLEARLRKAALSVRDLYEPGGELTEWTSLDAEEFDEYEAR